MSFFITRKEKIMLINGEEKALACPTVLSELLTQLGYRAAFVAIELNGNIIKQADFGSTTITDADKLEIVSFVGGG
ncbi:thiamine biosynthesis protein ThiS [Phascolarctobacterium succinatutens YIT 12067]|jgi:sulfur carrier protein|uniref:Thiamine biosynthesis protein ThiS n=2 Tax=Phascolarctobacterium succinatutens TaxID=626940 RepID=E8LB30_9FIRM|nr:thiamine biosynthesis protein ThiS [Phascolarctobacterium succinatutens YIT 12067]